jgi:methylmalonyl-CoA/ethylmalonyl-CoA epimerase
MKLRLHHIGFVTGDMSEYTRAFEALGLDQITEAVPNPLQKVTASFVNIHPPEDVHIELLESTDENSPITNFLKKRGGGLHHFCFEVDDIEGARARMEEKGFRLVVPIEQCEAMDLNFKRQCKGASKAAFFLVGKLLLELLEKSPER